MQATFDGALAHGDVVFLAPSEVGESGGPGFRGNDAQVAGDSPGKEDARLGFPVSDDLLDLGGGSEDHHDFLGARGDGNQIEILDHFLAPTKATADFRFLDGWTFPQNREETLRDRQGIAQAMEFPISGAPGNSLEQIGGGFFAKTLQGGEPAVAAGLFQGGLGLDLQFFAENLEFFWTQSGKIEQGEQAGGDGGPEFLEVG